ncbi:unnamed protein product [Sphagnum compactum]
MLLLREQKRLVLQHDKGDIDCVNGRSDRVGPNGGWGICEALLNRISDQLTSIVLEELDVALEHGDGDQVEVCEITAVAGVQA